METKPIKSFIKPSPDTTAKLIIKPLNMLPSEKDDKSPDEVEEEIEFIRHHILHKTNEAIEENTKAKDLLKKLGGDLMINAFACNFEIDGRVNEDVVSEKVLKSLNSLTALRWKRITSTLASISAYPCLTRTRTSRRSPSY